jgi:hypothetical protein
MGPRNAYKDMIGNVVSPITCLSMNHQNQLKQMANGAMFATPRPHPPRDLLVYCSPLPLLSLLLPLRPLDSLSVCAPFSSFASFSPFAGCSSECGGFARVRRRCSGARALAFGRRMIFRMIRVFCEKGW